MEGSPDEEPAAKDPAAHIQSTGQASPGEFVIHCKYCFISHAFYVIFPYTNFTIITQDVPGLGLGPGNGLGLTERDNEEIDSHRHLYVGFHVPKAKRTEGGKHHHHHGIGRNKHNLKPPVQNLRPGEEGSVLQPDLTSSSFEEFPQSSILKQLTQQENNNEMIGHKKRLEKQLMRPFH